MPPRRACDVCYKRKIQCSISSPDTPCNWCSHHNLTCKFTRNKPRNTKNRAKLSDVQELFDRVKQLESALAQATSSHQTPSEASPRLGDPTTPGVEQDESLHYVTPSSLDDQSYVPETTPNFSVSPQTNLQFTNLSFGQIRFSGRHLGQNWYYKGTPLLSQEGQRWISTRTGQEANLGRFQLFGSEAGQLPSAFSPPRLSISTQKLWELPEKTVTQEIINRFFRSPIRLNCPILDIVLFEDTMEIAYQSFSGGPSSPAQCSAIACVFAALSISCRLKGLEEVPLSIKGDVYAAKAHQLLGHVTGEASLANLQTVLLLQLHRTQNGLWQNATFLHSVACRMVCSLGGNVHEPLTSRRPETSCTERESRHIRMLFWLCYVLDKDISLRSGQPPLLTEDYCDLKPPEDYMSCYTFSPSSNEDIGAGGIPDDSFMPQLPGDPGLSYLKERTCRLLYAPQSFKITDSQLLHRIRQLDDELESWRLSIPPDFRPRLSIPPNRPLIPVGMKVPQMMRCINLQLEYHYLTTAIHTTVRRCGAASPEAGDLPEDLHIVVHSSTDLTLEASRSTLLFLKVPITVLAEEAFWHVVFYSTVAAMSLFTNILLHPLDPRVEIDIELLVSGVGIIRSMPTATLTHGEIGHVQETIDFIMELVQLGSCAISKAKREERRQVS
ncbi:hypothetical protein B0J13DRAFT_82829 [Dactylonectria estremocensis]|uniref:Zn(2)-C6 fungal-type domain-containing protein n=1 Tax=Dactylonectria estremocensis TaxID=1079267 RepID=A0A9P9IYK6_9HYPO|nr:hypothetical protein B0J13DRAFT_82829 [Dactylonectria estremocensis]